MGGYSHTLALRADGTVWAWGVNSNGQLGDGSVIDREGPVQVSGLTGVIDIDAGAYHSIALKSDGTVWTWGQNSNGELGEPSWPIYQSDVPIQVGISGAFVAVSAGSYFSVAVKSDGSVYAWGANYSGQLGDGTSNSRSTPELVSDLTGVVDVKAGDGFVVALKTDGTLFAWGSNWAGQLGNGTTNDSNVPVAVNGPTGIAKIAAGSYYGLALTSSGTLWGWGDNSAGQLGVGSDNNRYETPVALPGLSNVTQIAAGYGHSLAVKDDGTLCAWGYGYDGELGDGQLHHTTAPAELVDMENIVAAGVGPFSSFAVDSMGVVTAWGYNFEGQLADGVKRSVNRPVNLLTLTDIYQVSAGQNHVLALKGNGTVWAWGNGWNGQLGDGTSIGRPGIDVVDGLQGVTFVAAGAETSFAVAENATAWAWGSNIYGQLGTGASFESPSPERVSGALISENAVKVFPGSSHTLAMCADDRLLSWGSNGAGQLGDNSTTQRSAPVEILSTNLAGTIGLGAGGSHSVALKDDGTVWAWGSGASGRLGRGNNSSSLTPVRVGGTVTFGGVVSASTSGDGHTLALKGDGSVWAWGSGSFGVLGNGSNSAKTVPTPVAALIDVTAIAAGQSHNLALRRNSTVVAWGKNWWGQLGNGASQENQSLPVPVVMLEGIVEVSAGQEYSFARKEDGMLCSWGYGYGGVLANGWEEYRTVPRKVVNFNAVHDLPEVGVEIAESSGKRVGVPFEVTATTSTANAITKVEFFNNDGTKIGQSTAAPWSATWTPPTWGEFVVTAIATTENGSQVSSPGIVVNVSSDGDASGLPDWWEMKHFGHLGVSPTGNEDNDGLSNSEELALGTDPENSDTDGDGATDGAEVAAGTNPFYDDSDDDGIPDGYEIANGLDPLGDDAFDDLDGDRIPNIWEYKRGTRADLSSSRPEPDRIVQRDGWEQYWNLQDAIGDVEEDYEIIQINGGEHYGFHWNHHRKKILFLGEIGPDGHRARLINSQTNLRLESDAVVDGLELVHEGSENAPNLLFWSFDQHPIRVRVINCLFTGNYSGVGEVIGGKGRLEILHSTIAGNAAFSGPNEAVPIVVNRSMTPTGSPQTRIVNSILWNPSHPREEVDSTAEVVDSIVRGGVGGGFDQDPELTDSYRLTAGSFARNRGALRGVSVDIDGEARPQDSGVDLGWDEFLDSDDDQIADWWELKFFSILNEDSDADLDGLSNLEEYLFGSDPTNYYSRDGGIINATVTIVSGDNQTGTPGSLASEPLVVEVTDGLTPLTNAPISFRSYSGSISVAPSGSEWTDFIPVVSSGTDGRATVYFTFPLSYSTVSTIDAGAWDWGSDAVATFTQTTSEIPQQNPCLWFSADSGIEKDINDRVASWNSQGDIDAIASQEDEVRKPLFVADAINGKPTLRFDGTSTWLQTELLDAFGASRENTVFVVMKPGNWQPQYADLFDYDHFDHIGHVMQQDSGVLNRFGLNGCFVQLKTEHYNLVSSVVSETTSRIFLSGVAAGESEGYFEPSGPRNFTIGCKTNESYSRHFNGDIAEIIIYNRALSAEERVLVEKSLADKYGLYHPGAAWLAQYEGGVRVSIENQKMDKTRAASYAAAYSSLEATNPPVPIQGLSLWLVADTGLEIDGGGIAEWSDQSPMGNHAVQPNGTARPASVPEVIEQKPAVRFDGTDDFLTLADSPNFDTQNFTYIVVGAFRNTSGTRALLSRDPSWEWTEKWIFWYRDGALEYHTQRDYQHLRSAAIGLVPDNVEVFAMSKGGANFRFFRNNEEIGSVTNEVAVPTVNSDFRIGQAEDSFYFDGDIAEILIFDRELTEAERASLGNYLGDKYGIYSPEADWLAEYSGAVRDAIDFYRMDKAQAQTYALGFAALEASNPPISIDKLDLWLKADSLQGASGTPVSSWVDRSAFGKSFSQSDPNLMPILQTNEINGLPVVRFDGSDNLSTMGNGWPDGAFTVLFLLRPENIWDHNQRIGGVEGWGQFLFHTEGNGGIYVGTDLATRMVPGWGESDIPYWTVKAGDWQVFAFTYDSGAGKFYKNGRLISSKDAMAEPVDWTGFILGSPESWQSLHGDLAEVVVYSRALDQNELLGTVEYLKTKYSLNPDTDGDGMSDAFELANGLDEIRDDRMLDKDGDGVPNYWEYAKGTSVGIKEDWSGTAGISNWIVDPTKAADSPNDNVVESISIAVQNVPADNGDIASSYQTIFVRSGLYAETVEIPSNKRIALIGELNGDPPAIVGGTTDGDVVRVVGKCVVSGFIIGRPRAAVLAGNITGSGVHSLTQDVPVNEWLLTNCIIKDQAYGLYNSGGWLNVENCTFLANKNNGIFSVWSDRVRVKRSILWNSGAGSEFGWIHYYNQNLTGNIVRGGQFGGIDSDPLLDAAGRLTSGSPAIDGAGFSGLNADIDGDSRPAGSAEDFGADEWLDSDNDGLADAWERKWFGDLVSTSDDNDGLTLVEEALYGTNPTSADTDDDGLTDGQEIVEFGLDPRFAESVAEPPAFSPDAGFYRDPVTVTFSVNAPLPQIRYTLDGSEPTSESPLAPAEGITLTATATVKARAFRGDFALTPTGQRRYIVNSEARFPLNGVKLWMKADDGVQVDGAGKVTNWVNQTEATPAAVQTGSASRPALIPTALPNGLPVVRFSGSSTSLSIASPGNLHSTEGHMTVFVFGKWEGGANLGPFLAMPRSNSWTDGGWGLGRLHTGTNTGETLGLWSNNYSTQKATMTVPQNVYSLVGGMRDSEGLKVYLGGELAGTLAVSGTITPSTGSLFLGAHPATGRYLAGDIAEVLVYNRALNEGELAEVEAYFHDRYGRSVIRPIAMPPPGVYDGEVAVTLSSLTPGAAIRYTVDGSEPTETSPEASGPILLDQPGEITLKARAFADGAIPSAVVSGVYKIDDASPEYSAPLFNQESLVSGLTIAGAGALSIAAMDLSGINRVEFYVDGQLLGVSSTAPAGRYSLPWNITGAIPDGTHEVKFRIFDNLGKSSEVVIPVTLALSRPGAPAWTSPASGAEIAASSVQLKGTAAVGSTVTIYRNGSAVATGVPVNGNGQFEALVSLLEGSQVFTAAAAFRPGEVGPVSAGLAVVRDEAVPEAPLSLGATAQASGRVRLEWVASPSANVGNYKVYRAASPFDQAASATLIATTSAGTLTFLDTPSAGSRHYYRVQAVSTAQVAGPLSAQASAEADASAPTASAVWSSVSAPSAEGVFGVGRIAVRLTVSEPQQAVPFLSIQPAGGLPAAVSLTQDATNSLVFTGQYEIASGTPGGTAAVSFVGRDVAGNRGVFLTAGSGVTIDAQAPVVVAGSIPLAVKNDPENPVTIPIEIELNEPAAEAPTLKYRLSISQPQEQSLAMQAVPDSEGLNWTASLVLPATAGAETEDLTLSLAATDALGNAGGSFANPAAILVYQGQLPGLPPPMLRADSAPGGAVNLDWDAVPEADEYVLYWGQTDDVGSLVELATLPAGQLAHVHTPETDGTYYYAIAARRTVNDEESALILSAPAVSAVSDRVPPAAPADLQLALSGDGVSATWSRPAGSGSEPLTYQLLRGATSPVTLDAGVVREGIETTQTLDSSPTPAQTHYAVVALDDAGNRSAPSAPASLNAALYPPATFRITSKLDGSAPAQLEWTQNGTVHTAHLIAVGEDGALEPLATVPTGTNTYADASYSGGSKRYVISSVDAEDNASPARALRVPGISLVPAEGQSLGRGMMNRLRFTVTNTSEHALEQGVLKITASGREHASGGIQLAAGASTLVEVLVPGYLDMVGSSVALDIAFSVEPSPGASATLTSSVSLPVIDHAIPVTLQVRDLLRGGSGFASFTVENPGAEPLEIVLARSNGSMDSPDVRFRLEDTAGNLIVAAPVRTQTGGGVFNLPDGSTVLRIPAGATVTSPEFVIPVPETAPVEGVLALEIDRMWFRHGSPEAVDLPLAIERTAAVSTVEPPYSAVVLSAVPATSHGTVPVEISGTATLRGGGAAAGRPVALTIARGAYERTVEVVAGENGTFAYSFALGQGEPGGEFQVWAHHPDQTSRYPQASFLITRVVATPADIVVKAPRNYSQNIALQLQATGGGASAIRAELHAADQSGGVLPAGLTIHSGTVPSLTSTATLNLSLLGDSTAVESQIALRLVSNETAPGGFQNVRIRFSPGEARPALAVKPQSLSTGVAPGQSVSETLAVTNTGLAPLLEGSWKLLKSDGTAAPAWATQGSTGSFGQLEPGASVDLGLRFDPPAGETPADHYLKIVLKGTNHNAIEIPIHVAVSPSGEGNFALRVIDALTGGTAESGYVGGVAGARVRLQNANVPSIVHEAVTDANGEIGAQGGGLTDVPTGLYDLTISSDKHQPYRASLWIRPGATTSELAVLQYEPVKVSWEVVETTIQDKYEVQVTVDYETDVPIPVLVANPTAINLPTMKAGEVYSAEIVIQNHGTIAPDTVWFAAPPANSHYRFELLPSGYSRTAGGSASSTGGNVSGTAPASIPAGAVAFSVPPNGEAKISAQIVALRDSDDSSAGGYLGGQATTRCPNGSVFVQNLAVGVFAPRRRTTNPSASHPVVVVPPSGGGSWGGGSASWHPVGGAGGDDCFIPVFRPGGGGGGPDDGPDPVPGLEPEPEDDSCETCNSCEEGDIGANPSGSGAYQGAASSVDRINREYLDALTDLAIAAPDGRAILRRAFYGNAWHFAHEKRLDFLLASDHSGTATIVRQRVAYQARDAARTLFTAENYQIRKETAQGGAVTWRWNAPGGKWERFDGQGRLMEYGYRGETYGRVFYPEGASHPSQLQDAEGNPVIELTYADGKLTAAEDFAGNDVSYTWDNGRMTAFTDAAGQTTTMTYDSEGRMTGKVLPTGQQLSIAYTPAGFVSGITGGDRGSQQYAFSYNSTTRTHYMRVTYGTGRVVEYWYDRDGGLIRQAENGQTTRSLTRSGNTVTETDALGRSTVREYDGSDKLLRQVAPDGRVQTWQYDPVYGQTLRHIDARGMVSVFEYTAEHKLTRVIRGHGTPLEQTTTYEWDGGGRLVKITDPRGMVTAMTYDDRDFLLTRTVGHGTSEAQATSQTYNEAGYVETSTDPLGRVTQYEYDGVGRLLKTTNPLGEETVHTYLAGRLVKTESGRKNGQPGRGERRVYDEAGRILAEYGVGTNGAEILRRTMTYDAEGRVLTVSNALGQIVESREYDTFGRQIRQAVPNTLGGQAVSITEYDPVGRVSATISPDGLRRETLYDVANRPVRITEAPGTSFERVTEMIYDTKGDLIEERYPDGANPTLVTHYEYDVLGRRKTVSGDRVLPETLTYDAGDNVLTVTDGRGNTTTSTYDVLGRVKTQTLPPVAGSPSAVTTMTYDAAGNLLTQQDGDGRTTGFAYDVLGRRIATSIPVQGSLPSNWHTQAASVAQSVIYNTFGDPVGASAPAAAVASGAAVDANLVTTEHDVFGRPVQVTAATGLGRQMIRTTVYDALGRVVSTSLTGTGIATPQVSTQEYDAANPSLLRQSTDPMGGQTTTTYDAANRPVTTSHSAGSSTLVEYDVLGRPKRHTVTAPDVATQVTETLYDRFDQVTQLTLPGHTAQTPRIEVRTYTARGQLASQSGTATYALEYEYDATGNLTLMRDANGSETRWTYDARNRLAEKRYADDSVWSYTYDAAGNMTTRKDALDRTTAYAYNAFRQLSQINYTTDATVDFTFDAAGRRTGMTDGSGQTVWTPDAWNRNVSSTQSLAGRTLNYAFNGFGQRAGVTFAGGGLSGRTIAYDYDSMARLHTVADSAVNGSTPFLYSYQPGTAWVHQITTPSGSAIVNSRDALGRVTSTTFAGTGGQSLNGFAYGYNAAGQRATEAGPRGNISFGYNSRSELVGATGLAVAGGTAGDFSYNYDGIGNRLEAGGPGFVKEYVPNALNQYAAIQEGSPAAAGSIPAHDLNGNMTGDGAGATLMFDEENRLVTWEKGPKRSEFLYDGLSRRVETKEFEDASLVKTVRYVYDGPLPVEEQEWPGAAAGAPVAVRQITRGTDLSGSLAGAGGVGGLLAFSNGTTSAWYFADANGNVANLFKADDTVAAGYGYDPFGRHLSATGPLAASNTFQWSSKEHHEPSGLVYYLYRYYNPETGRWVNRDPIGEQGGANVFSFVSNSPTGFVDTFGESQTTSVNTPQAVQVAVQMAETSYVGNPMAGVVGNVPRIFPPLAPISLSGLVDYMTGNNQPVNLDELEESGQVDRVTGFVRRNQETTLASLENEYSQKIAKGCEAKCQFFWKPHTIHHKNGKPQDWSLFQVASAGPQELFMKTPGGTVVNFDGGENSGGDIAGDPRPHLAIESKYGYFFLRQPMMTWAPQFYRTYAVTVMQLNIQSLAAKICSVDYEVRVLNEYVRGGFREKVPVLPPDPFKVYSWTPRK